MTEKIEGWVVLETVNYEHQAEIIRDQLESCGIDCTVFSQKDHMNVVFVGDLSEIKILVPEDQLAQAKEAIKDLELPDNELSEDDDEVGEWESGAEEDDDEDLDEDEEDS